MALFLKSKPTFTYFLVAILFFYSNPTVSQSTFQRLYQSNGDSWGYSVIENYDYGYSITGASDVNGTGNSDLCIIKTDSLGNVLWSRTYGGPDFEMGNKILQTPDSSFFVVGETRLVGNTQLDIFIVKTNNNGDTIWTKTLGNSGLDRAYGACLTADGGIIVSGGHSWYGHRIFLMSLDFAGNIEWIKSYGGTANDWSTSVQQTNDGGFIMTGTTMTSNNNRDLFLMKTDSIGNLIWAKSYGGMENELAYSLIQASDGGFVMTGCTNNFGSGTQDIYIIKTDSNGDTTWTRAIETPGVDNSHSVIQSTTGDFVVTGWSEIGADRNVYILSLDSLGNLNWSRTIGGNGDQHFYDGIQTSDGGFMFAGYDYINFTVNYDIHLIKTDSVGIPSCNLYNSNTIVSFTSTTVYNNPNLTELTDSIIEYTNQITVGTGITDTLLCGFFTIDPQIESPHFNVFPNPSTGYITITADKIITSCRISITDMLSHEVYKNVFFGTQQMIINLEKLPDGVYIVSVSEDNKAVKKQLVLITGKD